MNLGAVFFYFLQGSYGRLGLGDSANQAQPKRVEIPTDSGVKMVSSSKGSDGHTLAVTVDGQLFSWGDGECFFPSLGSLTATNYN